MTVKELIEKLKEYPEDQSVHMRVWIEDHGTMLINCDLVAEKVQQGVSGAALITGTHKLK